MYDQAVAVLCNLKFIEKKATYGLAYELINDFQRLDNVPGISHDRLDPFKEFILANIHVITMFPKLVIQQAYNLPTSNIVTNSAAVYSSEKGTPFISWENKPDSSNDPYIMSFLGHSRPVKCCALNEDGSLLLSGSSDNIVKLWNTKTGNSYNITTI
jgi:hypothetical protein